MDSGRYSVVCQERIHPGTVECIFNWEGGRGGEGRGGEGLTSEHWSHQPVRGSWEILHQKKLKS